GTCRRPARGAAEAEASLDRMGRAVREVGSGLLDVVRVRVYVPDRGDVEAVSGVIKTRLGAARATNTTVCSPLAVDNARVEIEVTALKPPRRRPASRRSRARRRPR